MRLFCFDFLFVCFVWVLNEKSFVFEKSFVLSQGKPWVGFGLCPLHRCWYLLWSVSTLVRTVCACVKGMQMSLIWIRFGFDLAVLGWTGQECFGEYFVWWWFLGPEKSRCHFYRIDDLLSFLEKYFGRKCPKCPKLSGRPFLRIKKWFVPFSPKIFSFWPKVTLNPEMCILPLSTCLWRK